MQSRPQHTETQPLPHSFPFVVKDNVYVDLAQECRRELLQLHATATQSSDSSIAMKQAAMGTKKIPLKAITNHIINTPVEWLDTQYRSDLMLWVTPELCQQHHLTHVTTLIKRLIKTCSHLRKSHLPADKQAALSDFSVQFAVFVSPLLPLR